MPTGAAVEMTTALLLLAGVEMGREAVKMAAMVTVVVRMVVRMVVMVMVRMVVMVMVRMVVMVMW